jgi:hypothetical protein
MTRWTPVRCPRCREQVNRRMGLKFWLLSLLWLVPMFAAFQVSLLLPLAVLPVAFLVDHFLVPLCVDAG